MRIVPESKQLVQVGQVFGRLTVIGVPFYAATGKQTLQKVICECSCGCVVCAGVRDLITETTRSCGCLLIEFARNNNRKHGESKSGGLYNVWMGIRCRCYNANSSRYKWYGGRGITVCEEWLESYTSFRDWGISSGYRHGLELDRIDNNGNYCPQNCRWATRKEQLLNKSNNHRLTAFGETKTILEWTQDARCTVAYDTLWTRIAHCKWDIERAITAPSRRLAKCTRPSPPLLTH